MHPMRDALLNRSLRLTIVGTITAASLACLLLAYALLFDLLSGRWADAAGRAVWCVGSALAAILLVYYRDELIDD